jgi:FkbM family methyltransferase
LVSFGFRYNVAVGDGSETKNSQLYFNTNKGNGQALTDASRLEAVSSGIKIQSVDVASIDSILESKQFAWKKCTKSICNRFFLMKIDVEGFELRALRGSTSLFKYAAPPVIMIELAPGTIKGRN